jgi:hypothetical protein
MGGGPSSNQSSQSTSLPTYLRNFSHDLTKQTKSLYGQPLPQQNVAPFSSDQQAAFAGTEGQTADTQAALGGAQGANAAIASGANLNPQTNQYLQDYYNAAAAPVIENYTQAVAPNILANAVGAGGLGSSGEEQAFSNAQTDLGRSLGDLAANIYEPAYEQGLSQQASAIGQAPNLATGQYIPSQQLNQVGTQQQGQQQNILNTIFQNAMAPYTALTTQANMIGPLSGGQSNTISVSPNAQQSSK